MGPFVCGEHGARPPALVCQHLVNGRRGGFHCDYDTDEPGEVCPAAWCDLCQAVLASEREWNERCEAIAQISVICDLCYEVARARHWRQDTRAYKHLAKDAMAYLQARQSVLREEFRFGSYERYDWHQETGQLILSSGGRARLVADIQFVGSVSNASGTWLWAWANDSFLESVRTDARKVRKIGADRHFMRLAAARWTANEVDGWEMTAIAAFLLQAQGAYRSVSEQGFTFMTLNDIRWAQ